MPHLTQRRLALVCAGILAFVPALLGTPRQLAEKPDYFNGKVVPLATFLEKQNAKLDADANNSSLVLVTDSGKIYNLVKDTGSRMFFLDKGLLNRPMRLSARTIANSQMLQVVNVNSYVDGKLHEVYYWCDTCAIRDSEPGDCQCCGDKFVFREVPVK